ncbi:hypothetical protein AAG906_018886 [Vitis piasezkii]
MRAPLDAPPHLADSASQSRYHTRRASATPVAPTQIPPRGPPTKKAKTSEPGESSRAPRDSQYFGARQIAEAFHIPYAPADPTAFRRWAPLSEWDMVREPAAIVERASLLNNGLNYRSISIPELPEPRKSLLLHPLGSSSCAGGIIDAPPAVPPTVEPPITIPVRVPCLARFFSTRPLLDGHYGRMDHFQTQQDQQTLILREIQQHLGLVPPAPPVAVPSSVPAEDPSYPPEEPTT